MTPDAALALALGALLAEHRGCWRLRGGALESGEDAHTVWLDCLGCQVRIAFPKFTM